jgi:hypothetical protein
MTRLGRVLLCALSVGAGACEGVPTLTFAQADAMSDVGFAPVDATTDGFAPVDATTDVAFVQPDDAFAQDATPDVAVDASVEGGCPGANPPSNPFVCCGSVVCEGMCAGKCVMCINQCTAPGDFCCGKPNNVQCLSAGSICHN